MVARRKYRKKGDPPTLVCGHCKLEFHPLLREYGSKNHGFYYEQKFCSGRCRNLARNDGTEGHFDKHGYRLIAGGTRKARARPEHHIVMEGLIGRKILPGETVHHKNGKRADNRPENLELWSSRHGKGQRVSDRIHDANAFLIEQGQQWNTFGYGDVFNGL